MDCLFICKHVNIMCLFKTWAHNNYHFALHWQINYYYRWYGTFRTENSGEKYLKKKKICVHLQNVFILKVSLDHFVSVSLFGAIIWKWNIQQIKLFRKRISCTQFTQKKKKTTKNSHLMVVYKCLNIDR